jgi:hypothetical protein
VHTYSAAAVERILNVKDPAPAGAARGAGAPRVSAEALQPMVPQLLTHLFSHIVRPDYPENEYLMRCVLRTVVVAGPGLAPMAPQIIQALTAVLVRVCGNPANPTFNHFLFETVASLMRSVCAQRAEAAADFEAMLMPPFQGVLSKDVAEFLPYVFQLLAELLELHFVVTHCLVHRWEDIAPHRFSESRRKVEDYEMWFKMARAGVQWTVFDAPIVDYRCGVASMSHDFAALLRDGQAVVAEAFQATRAMPGGGPAGVDASTETLALRHGRQALTWATRMAIAGGPARQPSSPAPVMLIGMCHTHQNKREQCNLPVDTQGRGQGTQRVVEAGCLHAAFPSFSVAPSSHRRQLVVADKVRAAIAAPAAPLAVPVEAGGAERHLADLLADERLLLILLLHALMLRFGRKPDSFSLRSC